MTTFREITATIRSNRKELKQDYGLLKIGIFGSYARDEQDKNSDIDILVEIERPMGLIKLMGLERRLSGLLNTKVDLVTKKALKPYIGKRVLEEVRYV